MDLSNFSSRYAGHPYFGVATRIAEIWSSGHTSPYLFDMIDALPTREEEGRGAREFFLEVLRDFGNLRLHLYPFATADEFAGFLITAAEADPQVIASERAERLLRRNNARASAEDMLRQRAPMIQASVRSMLIGHARMKEQRVREYAERQIVLAVRAYDQAIQRGVQVDTASLPPEVRERIEARERSQQAQAEAELAELLRVRERFETLGVQIRQTTSRDELVNLGRERAEIAPLTGFEFTYRNHCWNCGTPIYSEVNPQCAACQFYICACGECLCGFPDR